MKKTYYFLFSLLCMFFSCVVFAKNEIFVESMIPVYDENSGVIVTEEDGMHNVIFNDKNQKVEYNIVIKNNTDSDIPIDCIEFSEVEEEFFKYGIKGDEVLEANSSSDLILSLETIETEGWGRNFEMEFVANVDVDNIVENPNTATKNIMVLLVCVTFITGTLVISTKSKKISKYCVLIIMFGFTLSFANAKFVIELPIRLNVSFESKNIMKPAYVLNDGTKTMVDYWYYAYEIQNIYVQNEFSEITEYYKKFDVSENKDGKVLAYLVVNEDDEDYLDLYLQANGIIYMNQDASNYFDGMIHLEKIDNMTGFGTDNVINMTDMFAYTGYYSKDFSIDLSKFDTSNVTNMSYMFRNTGSAGESFKLDLSSFNTSKVTDMSYMFNYTGALNNNIEIDLSSFDTSNVINMKNMFSYAGHQAEKFELDLSGFNTSKVTDMSYMFSNTGRKANELVIDLTSFDTSNVTNMRSMFYYTGYESDIFGLDLSSFDTSKVTDMAQMFYFTGSNSPDFTLDVSSFNTSKVTDMSGMFNNAGSNSSKFQLDLENFDTSNVTSMSNMFQNIGNKNPDFKLDLSSFDTSKVTNMRGMFYYTGRESSNFELNIRSFDTSKVKDMGYMFYHTGRASTILNIDLSVIDFSSATNLDNFFINAGSRSNKFVTSLYMNFPKNPSLSTFMSNNFGSTGSSLTLDYTSRTSRTVSHMVSGGANIIKGKLRKVHVDDVMLLDEIIIGDQVYYVVDYNDASISLYSNYSLGSNGKQSKQPVLVPFASTNGWQYTPGPQEIDNHYYSNELKELLHSHYTYINGLVSDDKLVVDLATLYDLSSISCYPFDDYSYVEDEDFSCSFSVGYNEEGSYWWTRSAVSNFDSKVWAIKEREMVIDDYASTAAVRPVVTISKGSLKELYRDIVVS